MRNFQKNSGFHLGSGLTLTLEAGTLKVEDFYFTAPRPGSHMTAAYGKITNTSKAKIKISSVSSPAAAHVDMHRSVEKGKMIHMEPIPHLDLSPGETIELKPRGLHLMIMGLQKSLGKDEALSFTFSIEGQKEAEIFSAQPK